MREGGALALYALVGLTALAVCGCSSGVGGHLGKLGFTELTGRKGKVGVIKEPAGWLEDYGTVEIEEFENPMRGLMPDAYVPQLSNLIEAAFNEKAFIPDVKQVKRASIGPATAPTMVLRGRFTDYEKGKREMRVLGSGAAHVTVRTELVDKATGKVLASGIVRGTVKSAFKGEDTEALEEIAQALVNYTMKHYSPETKEKAKGFLDKTKDMFKKKPKPEAG